MINTKQSFQVLLGSCSQQTLTLTFGLVGSLVRGTTGKGLVLEAAAGGLMRGNVDNFLTCKQWPKNQFKYMSIEVFIINFVLLSSTEHECLV